MMTFQSRFGREPWLTPYTDETLKMLGEKGTKHIQVLCPGFCGRLSRNAGRDRRPEPGIIPRSRRQASTNIFRRLMRTQPEHIEMMVSSDGALSR